MVRRPLNVSILPDTSSFAPGGICRFAVEPEEHQLGEAGAVGHHHPPGLALVGGRLDAHHLDRQRGDLARPRLRRSSGASRRSTYDSGRWNSRSITRSPPAALAISAPPLGPTPFSVVSGENSGRERIVVHGLTWG